MKLFTNLFIGFVILFGSLTQAAPINGTGLLTSNVIFGSGNVDGSWTGESNGSIEVALRGKLRYDGAGNPQNVFNYDGVDTYIFDSLLSAVPTDRSIFNFEFSVNSDTGGAINRNINDIIWNLTIDNDPTAAIFNIFDGDPFNVAFSDHSFGNNSTANGAGTEAVDATEYALLYFSNNVAQNSSNLGFGLSLDPDAPGIYSFTLSGSDSTGLLASTNININVIGSSVVAVPAKFPVMFSLIFGISILLTRKKSELHFLRKIQC